WSLGNQMIMTNTPNATPIQLSYAQGSNTYYLSSPQGFVSFNNNYNIVEHGDATNIAPYFGDSWKSDRWLVDASARLETIDAHQRTCNSSPQQLGTIYQLYETAVPVCNGTWNMEHYVKAKPSFTIGANYELSHNMSVYVRWNTGAHFDDFDNGIRGQNGNFAPLQTVKNYEGGFKWQTQLLYLDISVYHRQFTGLQYQETNATGVATGAISTYGSDSKGINFSGTIRPFKHFDINVLGDYMDGHYTHYTGCASYIDINGNSQCAQIDGAPLQRQPKFQISVTPSYVVPATWGDVTSWLTYEHVGQRYEDQSGLQPLGSYYMLSAGVVADVGDNWQFRLQGTNLTNQIGLTEGNARKFGYEVGINNVIMARPIQGREVNIEAKYKF
ncbi:MAG TPA: TonB-dependent receptor, partial [Steroidobacteraceae bacterium]|nr:TonB-dependent receptor [Steroidobacteraceae bacterium]